MKGVKWAVGWKDKQNLAASTPLTPEELKERMLMKKKTQELKPKRGEPIQPTIYPLVPVQKDKKLKRLPTYLKKCSYRKGRVN